MRSSTKYLAGGGLIAAAVLVWLYYNGWPEAGEGGTGKRSNLARIIGLWLLTAWCVLYGLMLRTKGE